LISTIFTLTGEKQFRAKRLIIAVLISFCDRSTDPGHGIFMCNNWSYEEIVPDKLTSTILRGPSLAHNHDSAGSSVI
jgi:hypothetical protein